MEESFAGDTSFICKRRCRIKSKNGMGGSTETAATEKTTSEEKIADKEVTQISPPQKMKRKADDKTLWKIMKGKFLLATYLCKDDWNKLYHNKEKVRRVEDRLAINFDMCEDCARLNCYLTDITTQSTKYKMTPI
ncbi:hypothetical protein GPALN_003004 [Globodera pallida]|nr:hypothetical protein GPALN_003004 [Globodera pallida]